MTALDHYAVDEARKAEGKMTGCARESDPKSRFSDRVENYVRYRPSYPPAVSEFLHADVGVTPGAVVADVGSGTGISSELFLRAGHAVYGIEPNADMCAAAGRLLANYPRFVSVNASAESTTLNDASVDLVVAGQAFHWFDPAQARHEFARILRPGGRVALIWNRRLVRGTPFLEAYEELLLDYGTDYASVRHDNIDATVLASVFRAGHYHYREFPNGQSFDFDGLRGRLLSSSYTPPAGHPRHQPMLEALRRLFDRYEVSGTVEFLYSTEVHVGRVAKT